MSGRKTFNVTAGISTASQPGVFDGIASVLQAYQERKRQEREAAIRKEQDIQQKIAQIRSGAAAKKIIVQKPQHLGSTTTNVTIDSDIKQALSQDAQRQVQNLKMQLPSIKSEYQTLVDQQLLDAVSVQQAIHKTETALQSNNLTEAQTYLQVLDDARIQVTQQMKTERTAQLEFIQSRLGNLQPRLPESITQQLQTKINGMCNSWQSLSDADITTLHQEISTYESQAEQIQTAAENLVASWQQVGYIAQIAEINDGDVVIEVETHEGVNTQMRIQFDGQQIDLAGPHDEEGESSCASRTFDVIELFQQQGYQVEWTQWNGEPVDQEWRNVDMGIISVKTTIESDFNHTFERRSESIGD
ncbi:hypothetical protein [Trichormus variabilis]|uniref:Uncharacterized protein n=1 Tax=Trichormus variabilis SAG 1403-4b TaxID=447716 RepID=A0A433UHC9_ANAVA|nr:hypothetical protein [Trichormus variabilis]MBD2625905.1 hypothetical protein [Trichormus variabilis FACHB-164]RUS93219.1 hypothetical protein DSM107003_45350 [Trichormus variabilis SAG 1403-4b]